jgi:hypothetical protein
VTPDNFGGKDAGVWVHEADTERLRAEAAEAALFALSKKLSDSEDQRLALLVRAHDAEFDRDKLRGDIENYKAVIDALKSTTPTPQPIDIQSVMQNHSAGQGESRPENNEGTQPQLTSRAVQLLAIMEDLYDDGAILVRYADLTARTSKEGFPIGSIGAALKLLGEQGYVANHEGIRTLLKRANGTLIPRTFGEDAAVAAAEPLPESSVEDPIEGVSKDADNDALGEPEASTAVEGGPTKPPCDWCFDQIPDERKGRFCSNECAKEWRLDEERRGRLAQYAPDSAIEIVTADTGIPFKKGSLPAPKPFNSPFAAEADRLRDKLGK